MKQTNYKIYKTAQSLIENFQDTNQYLPIKLNFFIQKNKKTLMNLAQDIEESRLAILRYYGTIDEETQKYSIAPENIKIANKEIEDLFNIEQDVDILTIKFEDIPSDISLTTGQMEAIMFMIE